MRSKYKGRSQGLLSYALLRGTSIRDFRFGNRKAASCGQKGQKLRSGGSLSCRRVQASSTRKGSLSRSLESKKRWETSWSTQVSQARRSRTMFARRMHIPCYQQGDVRKACSTSQKWVDRRARQQASRSKKTGSCSVGREANQEWLRISLGTRGPSECTVWWSYFGAQIGDGDLSGSTSRGARTRSPQGRRSSEQRYWQSSASRWSGSKSRRSSSGVGIRLSVGTSNCVAGWSNAVTHFAVYPQIATASNHIDNGRGIQSPLS